MVTLPVPYIPQINFCACGAAALAMVYKYYKLEISQEALFRKYAELEPHGSNNFRITTDNLVEDAVSRGFDAQWARVRFRDEKESMEEVSTLLHNYKIPIIVCQKYTDKQPLIGHFRVVIGADESSVVFHDPDPTFGGPHKKWPITKFMKYWQPTGMNVTGGIMVVIRPIDSQELP